LYLYPVGAGEHGALRWLAAMVVALPLTGCDLPACEILDLTHSRPVEQTGDDAPAVLAVSDRGTVSIVRACTDDCSDNTIVVDIGANPTPDQLMLTGSGRWLVVHREGELTAKRFDLDTCTFEDTCTPDPDSVGTESNIAELVGTLRGGDWIIYWTTNRKLWAVYVGDDELLDDDESFESEFALGNDPGLLVVALGHRHVVASKRRGDGTEELYLIRVAPAPEVDEFARTTTGEAKLLATGLAFRRVLITEGPSPAQLDLGKDEVPTDAQVIVTSGEGPDARTLIYGVANRSQIANFAGEIVTKHAVLEDVPGLSAVSPDGTHLSYLTSDGGLALRNLATQRSCLIKSSNAATHLLAGFAADATLYFEVEEEAYLNADGTGYQRQTVENIHAYDPLTGIFTAITTAQTDPLTKVWRLKAVPPRRDRDEQPWAIAAYEGEHIVKPDAKAHRLDYEEARFLPRANDDLWVIEATTKNLLDIHQLTSDGHEEQLIADISTPDTVCVSSSPAAGWTAPWATRCSDASEPETFLDNGFPDPEQGP
jgi:hypothetical protein